MFPRAIICDMRFRQLSNGNYIMHDLYNGIGVRIEDVSLQAAEISCVIESNILFVRYTGYD